MTTIHAWVCAVIVTMTAVVYVSAMQANDYYRLEALRNQENVKW